MSDLLRIIDLDEQDLPPSTVDLDAALRSGRRRERRNRAVKLTAVATAVLVAAAGVALAVDRPRAPQPTTPSPSPSSSAPPWDCVIDPSAPEIDAIDPTGQFTVTLAPYGSGKPPVLSVRGGQPRELTGLPGLSPVVHRVNAAGVVIGSSRVEPLGDFTIGWVYRDGRAERLPLPAGAAWVEPLAINARGDIVGLAYDGSTTDIGGISARSGPTATVLWAASAPQSARVVVAGDDVLQPSQITDDGTLVGRLWRKGHAIRRPDGTVVPLPESREVIGITGEWVVGVDAVRDSTGEFSSRAFRYNVRTGAKEELGAFIPWAVLSEGRLAVELDEGGKGAGAPAIWHDGRIDRLPGPPGAVWSRIALGGGRTVVGGMRINGTEQHAVVWRC